MNPSSRTPTPFALCLSTASLATALLLGSSAPSFAAPSALSEITVDVQEESQPVRDVLRRLEERHGLNYVVSEEVLRQAGTVTVSLRGVPLDAALEAICSACGLSLEIRGPILVILPKAEARAPLPKVSDGLIAPATRAEDGWPGRVAPRSAPDAFRARDPRPAPPKAEVTHSMAVGTVVAVELPERRMQLLVDGVKRDFFLPSEHAADPKLQTARLGQALATLASGDRVALLYERHDGRAVITNLIGGTQVQDQSLAAVQARRASADKERPASRRRPPPAPLKPQTAPESALIPDGVLAGRFVAREGDTIQVRRATGEVVTAHVPGEDDVARRAKVLAVIDTLKPDAQVFLTYETLDGKVFVNGGIAETRAP